MTATNLAGADPAGADPAGTGRATDSQTGSVLRAGVIGLGWAGQQHIDAYAADPAVELVAISGKEQHLLDQLGDQHDVAGRYPDYTTMLTEEQLDVVSIATPTFLHAPMTVQALEAGVNVLCEKPMAETGEAAATMVEAARRTGKVLDIAFNHRQRGDVAALREVVESGVLGEIYYAKTGWLRRKGIPGMGTWFTSAASAGGGALMDIGVHMLDMSLHLMGEPKVTAVSASTHAQFGPRGRGGSGFGVSSMVEGMPFEVEDLASAFLRMEDGGTLLLETSWAQWIPYDQVYVTLYGSEGGASVEWGGNPRDPYQRLNVWTEVQGMPAELRPEVGEHGKHAAAVANFLEKVRTGEPGQHVGLEALRRARILDACYASAKQGAEVSIEP